MEPHEIPDNIGRFEVIQYLASGGMADLFLCRQSGPMGFEKIVALKQIRSRHSDDGEFLTMFMDEARTAALLNHPNIAQIYELGSENGTPYMAMEFVNGRNLSAIFKKTVAQGVTMPSHIVAGMMVGILRGLAYAHGKTGSNGQPLNLVHRDVTPQNVLISHDGQVKLVDFGIAKVSNQMARTRHGVIKGKYSYMSPEQVRSQPLDGRSDLFAVGILLYEALTAHRPFKRGTTVDTLKAVISEAPPDPRRFNAALSKPMVDIIARSLFKKREKRFANAEQMLNALERFLHAHDEPVTPKAIAVWVDALFQADADRSERTIVLKDVGELLLPDAASESVSEVAVSNRETGIPERTVISMLSEVEPQSFDEQSSSISLQVEDHSSSTFDLNPRLIESQVSSTEQAPVPQAADEQVPGPNRSGPGMPGGNDEVVGSHLSSTLEDQPQLLDSSATIPHRPTFNATLDDLVEADDRTQISDPPVMARLDPVSEPSDKPAAVPMPPPPADAVGGFRITVDDSLPPRPGPSASQKPVLKQIGDDFAEHRVTLLKFIALGVGIGVVLLAGLILFAG